MKQDEKSHMACKHCEEDEDDLIGKKDDTRGKPIEVITRNKAFGSRRK